MTPFDTFWAVYPARVAKKDAQKAFAKAMKETTLQTILAGVERYKQTKPEWCAWSYPATWLNKERWDDEAPSEIPIPSRRMTGLDALEARLAQEIASGSAGGAGAARINSEALSGLPLFAKR